MNLIMVRSLFLFHVLIAAFPIAQDSSQTFGDLMIQHNELQEQTMMEGLEMQKAQAFWNTLELMSKKTIHVSI